MNPLTLIKKLHSEAKKYNERRLVVLAGDRDRSYDLLSEFIAGFKGGLDKECFFFTYAYFNKQK